MHTLNDSYWNGRYLENQTGWDIGYASFPIKSYINQLTNTDLRILIPGCGNAYEAEYLYDKGFEHVFILDWSEEAISNVKNRLPSLPEDHFIQEDFFKHTGSYDLIFEQTFFCAIDPALRKDYVTHCHSLLKEGGKLVGLLFNVPLNEEHPPFGGSKEEYQALFQDHFDIHKMETAYNSIEPRQDNELFIIMKKA